MPTDEKNLKDQLRALMAAGRKIEAIKQYRDVKRSLPHFSKGKR
jgi:hypothetical protein